jgi:prephenate dehydrogenase
MERKCVAVIGVGLIGGSLAIRLHEKKLAGRLLGVDANPVHAQQALELELVDEMVDLDEAIERAQVLILSIPVDGLQKLLPSLLDRIDQQIVIDLGSTKSILIESVKDHPRRGRFVATHPMWGTEYSGPAAARSDAFANKAVIICNAADTDPDALEWTRAMYRKIGMHLLEMEAGAHDLHAAYVSHISHITSFALANTVLEKEQEEQAIFEMASAGFESTVRLAKSNPNMWVPIFIQNRHHVLDVLNEHIDQLCQFRDRIEAADEEGLRQLMEKANGIRRILNQPNSKA